MAIHGDEAVLGVAAWSFSVVFLVWPLGGLLFCPLDGEGLVDLDAVLDTTTRMICGTKPVSSQHVVRDVMVVSLSDLHFTQAKRYEHVVHGGD